MREFLTGLGILICLALIAAMAGPHFVDWGRHRAVFEARISAVTGHPVRIDGPISLTLLPTPTLSLEQVKVGRPDARGFAMFEAERISGALSATALLRGDITVTEALIDGPLLRVDARGLEGLKGQPVAGQGANPDAVSIDKLVIKDGSIIAARPGREALTISSIAAELEATSLLGPAKGNGTFVAEGSNRHLRFAMGRVEAGKARLKLLLEDVALALRLDIDGVATLDGAAPGFDGSMALSGNPGMDERDRLQIPLKSSAKMQWSGQTVTLEDLAMSLGGEPMPLTLTGRGVVHLSPAPRYELTLSARSFDFDKPGPDGRARLAVPAELIRQVSQLTAGNSDAPLPDGKVDLSIGGMVIGGQTVSGAHVVAEMAKDRLRIHRLEGELPGQTRVRFARDSLSDEGILSGLLEIDSRDPERLNGWFNGVQRVATAAAAIRANAVLSSVKDGVSIDAIEIDRGGTHLSGRGAYLLAVPRLRPAPRVTLQLASPRLNIEDIPAFVMGGEKKEEKPELDFEVDLDAHKLVLEGRETGRLVAKARRDGQIISIERLAITDLDGASLIASGALGGGSRRVTVKLDAEKVDGIAAIAERVFPGAFTKSLRKRAASLSPALVVASLANDDNDDSFDLNADGHLANTDLRLGGKLAGKGDLTLSLSLALQNADGAALARQLVAGQGAVTSGIPGSVRLSTKGNLRGALDLDLDIALAGLSSKVLGQIRIFQPFSPFEGTIVATVPDLVQVATALSIDPVLAPAGAGRLTGVVQSNLERITISELKANLGTTPLQGEIAFNIAEGGRVSGQLKTPAIDLRPVFAAVTGMGAPVLAGRWSAEPFARPVMLPLIGDLWIESGQAVVDAQARLDAAKFVLRFDNGAASIEYSDLRLNGARLTGDVFLRRNGASVALTSKMSWADMSTERVWTDGMKGLAEGELQLVGAGVSPAKIMQSLSGSGAVRLRNASIPAFDGQALPRLVAGAGPAAEAAGLLRRLEAEMDKAALAAPEMRASLVVIDGVVRIGTANVAGAGVKHEFSGTLDLAQWLVDLRATSTAAEVPPSWRGATPQVTTQWRGPVAAPRRSVSADALINGFLATRLQKDLELGEIQEQDARERAFFNRRLKASEQEKRRIEEAKAEQIRAEQARMAEEDRQRRQQALEAAARAQQQQLRNAIGGSSPPGAPLDLSPPAR